MKLETLLEIQKIERMFESLDAQQIQTLILEVDVANACYGQVPTPIPTNANQDTVNRAKKLKYSIEIFKKLLSKLKMSVGDLNDILMRGDNDSVKNEFETELKKIPTKLTMKEVGTLVQRLFTSSKKENIGSLDGCHNGLSTIK